MTRARSTTRPELKRERINAVGTLLTQVHSALFITGPGLTSESGLPHYRGIPGLLRKTASDARAIETALSIDMLQRKPEVTWRFLLAIDEQIRAAAPNRGHEVLVGFERSLQRTAILTVNVDRLHQRAGSHNVIEMHGALHDLRCPRCEISTRHAGYPGFPLPPLCATCSAVLRPDMPLFGEPLPPDAFTRLQGEIEIGFDIVVAVGVVTMFPYLARPILLAKQDGIPTVEIGQTSTDVSEIVDFGFRGSPARILGAIWDVFSQLAAHHPE